MERGRLLLDDLVNFRMIVEICRIVFFPPIVNCIYVHQLLKMVIGFNLNDVTVVYASNLYYHTTSFKSSITFTRIKYVGYIIFIN